MDKLYQSNFKMVQNNKILVVTSTDVVNIPDYNSTAFCMQHDKCQHFPAATNIYTCLYLTELVARCSLCFSCIALQIKVTTITTITTTTTTFTTTTTITTTTTSTTTTTTTTAAAAAATTALVNPLYNPRISFVLLPGFHSLCTGQTLPEQLSFFFYKTVRYSIILSLTSTSVVINHIIIPLYTSMQVIGIPRNAPATFNASRKVTNCSLHLPVYHLWV